MGQGIIPSQWMNMERTCVEELRMLANVPKEMLADDVKGMLVTGVT